MPLELRDRTAVLSGVVTVEDAEPLAEWLRDNGDGRVALRRCTHAHTAVVQALLRYRPRLLSRPVDPVLAVHLVPLLTRDGDAVEGATDVTTTEGAPE